MLYMHRCLCQQRNSKLKMPIININKKPRAARVGPTVLVVIDLENHPRSLIFIASERAYATSY